eukprot:UN10770
MCNTSNPVNADIDLMHPLSSEERLSRLISGSARYQGDYSQKYTVHLPLDILQLCRKYIGKMEIRSNTEIEHDRKHRFKVLVVGAGAVGKTSIIHRIAWDVFNPGFDPCIEEYYTKTVEVDSENSFHSIQRFPTLQQRVCDLELDEWRDRKYGILCGNKCDLDHCRQVSRRNGEELARKWGSNVTFMETSAKSNINLKEVLMECVRMHKKHVFRDREEQPTNAELAEKCCMLL